MYKLREWINESALTKSLSLNEHAVEYLEEHPEKIDYYRITYNINAIHIIEKNLNNINYNLHTNPNMLNLLRNNRELLDGDGIFYHDHHIEFIEELIKNNELNKINWDNLSCNHAAIHILEQYSEKINWGNLIYNKNAEHLIRNNLEKVEKHWDHICGQSHLINLIEEHPEKIHWGDLSSNYNAIHLLINNLNNININNLRANKNGFELLILLNHQFDDELYYDENIVYVYWNYCKTHDIEFTLIDYLNKYGYTDEHFEFIQNNPIDYALLSQNPNTFIYDYARMKKTRQQQPWYRHIKNEFI